MKRRIKTPESHLLLKPVRLYLDDLENIVEMFKSRGFEIELSDSDYEFDSLEEIKDYRGKKIRVLNLNSKSERVLHDIKIQFSKRHIWLSRHSDDENILLLWHELKDFLKSKLYWHQRVLDFNIWGLILLLSPSFIFYPMIFGASSSLVKEMMWFLFPCILGPLFISILWTWYFPGLYVDRRFRVLNFWQRNSDNIILLLIGAVLGFLVKWLFDFF